MSIDVVGMVLRLMGRLPEYSDGVLVAIDATSDRLENWLQRRSTAWR